MRAGIAPAARCRLPFTATLEWVPIRTRQGVALGARRPDLPEGNTCDWPLRVPVHAAASILHLTAFCQPNGCLWCTFKKHW
jgi:hypothetical protein